MGNCAHFTGGYMPYTEDQLWAIRFLRETKGHSCYVCRGGEADCGTIGAREDAWALLRDVPERHQLIDGEGDACMQYLQQVVEKHLTEMRDIVTDSIDALDARAAIAEAVQELTAAVDVMVNMHEHEETHCLYCDKSLPTKGIEKNYCNTDCAWKDGERWERDRRHDMARYSEV